MICYTSLIVAVVALQGTGPLAGVPTKILPPKPADSKVVAKVNGQVVTAKDISTLIWSWMGDSATDEVVNYLVVQTEAIKQSVKVTPQEVELELEKQIKEFAAGLPPGSDLEAELRQRALFRSAMYMGVEASLLIKKLMLRRFDSSEFVKVSTIIFKPKSEMTTDVADAIKKASDAYTQLLGGALWDKVLETYTTNPGALKAKGLLGWRNLALFPTNVQAELKKLKPGGLTHPAETQFGVQIFRLELAGKDAKQADLDALKNEYVATGMQSFMQKLRAGAKIERPK